MEEKKIKGGARGRGLREQVTSRYKSVRTVVPVACARFGAYIVMIRAQHALKIRCLSVTAKQALITSLKVKCKSIRC